MRVVKSKFVRRSSTVSEIDLTPMLDVIFILLIFFVVTASFVKEAGLPEYSLDRATDAKANNKVFEIYIKQDGRILIQGRTIPLRAVRALVAHALFDMDGDAGVMLVADAYANVNTYIAVVDAIQQANTRNISMKINLSEP